MLFVPKGIRRKPFVETQCQLMSLATRIRTDEHDVFFEHVEEVALPNLLLDSTWHAEQRRIRIRAQKT